MLTGRSYIDFSFFNIEYWKRDVYASGTVHNITFDYMYMIGSFFVVDFGNCGDLYNLDFAHNDLIINIPLWADRLSIHNQPVLDQWDGRIVKLTADNPHNMTFEHNRFVRGMDGLGLDADVTSPHDIIVRYNHFIEMRDDAISASTQQYNTTIMYNYWQRCFTAVGSVRRGTSNPSPNTFHVGFNIIEIDYLLEQAYGFGAGSISAPYNGLHAGSVDTTHGDNSGVSERKYYHNTIICGKNAQTAYADVFAWISDVENASYQSERYNNVIVQTSGANLTGRTATGYCEQDYNIWWSDPAGIATADHIRMTLNSGAHAVYADWATFKASGANYNETKHANGQGPGSANGWNQNGREADPDFVNGKWETIVAGDLSSYFPENGGNLEFAVSLTGTGWPGTSSPQSYVGAYAPGDAVTKIGPEQGLWTD